MFGGSTAELTSTPVRRGGCIHQQELEPPIRLLVPAEAHRVSDLVEGGEERLLARRDRLDRREPGGEELIGVPVRDVAFV